MARQLTKKAIEVIQDKVEVGMIEQDSLSLLLKF